MPDLTPEGRQKLGSRIDDARRRKKLSHAALAKDAGYDEKTIRNVINGELCRLSTLEIICQVVEIELEAPSAQPDIKIADVDHGEYTLSQYKNYLGFYYGHRRGFTRQNDILRTIFEIFWSDESKCLKFYEHQRYGGKNGKEINFSQEGDIFISQSVGMINLVTLKEGSVRLIALTRLRLDDFTMCGAVLTPSQQTYHFQPSISPFFLKKAKSDATVDSLVSGMGVMTPGVSGFDEANEYLAEIEQEVGIFALSIPGASGSYLRMAR